MAIIAIFVYKNFDFITEITFKVDRPETSAKKDNANKNQHAVYTDLEIDNLQITPIDSKLPSYLYFEVKNTGRETANKINLHIDVGRAKINDFELRPAESLHVMAGGKDSNILKILIDSMNVDETVYVYCQLSAPVFNAITLNSENLLSTSSLKFSDLKIGSSNREIISSSFMTYLRLLLGAFIFVAVAFFTIVLFGNLYRIFKVDKL